MVKYTAHLLKHLAKRIYDDHEFIKIETGKDFIHLIRSLANHPEQDKNEQLIEHCLEFFLRFVQNNYSKDISSIEYYFDKHMTNLDELTSLINATSQLAFAVSQRKAARLASKQTT
mgnify:CR=1 FL=1